MVREKIAEDAAKYAATLSDLAERISQSVRVRELDAEGEPQAWTIAHGLLDIAASLERLSGQLVPALAVAANGEQVDDLLQEVEEELRHVVYHIADMDRFSGILAER